MGKHNNKNDQNKLNQKEENNSNKRKRRRDHHNEDEVGDHDAGQRYPKQTRHGSSKVSERNLNSSNAIAFSKDEMRQMLPLNSFQIREETDNNALKSNQLVSIEQAKGSLIDELDAIDAQFETAQVDPTDVDQIEPNSNELDSPDGIGISVNQEEDEQFGDGDNEIDYEETVYPVTEEGQSTVDSDAETEKGEEPLNDSISSSLIITFKDNQNGANKDENHRSKNREIIKNASGAHSSLISDKKIEDMTPDELVEANPALQSLMEKLLHNAK